MIKITEEDKEKICHDVWDRIVKLDLSSGSYYAKFTGNTGAFRELFGKKIFDMIGITSPEYIYLKEKNCILSTDLNRKYKKFVFASELNDIASMNILYDTLKQFKNFEELVTQVNIMHFVDILFCNTDRHTNNYGFAVNEDNTAKLVVLDNELMLEDFKHATRPVSFPTHSHLVFTEYSKECEYKYFMEGLSEKHKELIKYYIEKLDLKTIYSIMKSIERENNCKFKNKNKLFRKYIKNYIMIYKCTMMNNKTLTRRTK